MSTSLHTLSGKSRVHEMYTRAIILVVTLAGVIMMVYPVQQTNSVVAYNRGYYGDELDGVIGYSPPGDYASVHFTSGNAGVITLQVALGGVYTPIFTNSFQAGSIDVPLTLVRSGGTVFLTITSNNRVFTSMNVHANISEVVNSYPLIPLGIGALGIAGILTIITKWGRIPLGSLIRRPLR